MNTRREALSILLMAIGIASVVVALLQGVSTALHVLGGLSLIYWAQRVRR